MKHGERFLEDWRAMVVLGLTLATCFQESVWAAAAQVSPLLLLPLSDSLKISQLILSSCVTSCSAQAAINYLKILCFIW